MEPATPISTPNAYYYNVTQTLAPFYHKHNIHKQLFTLTPLYIKVLDNLFTTSYEINIEITQKGNIHFHSQIISLYNKDDFTKYYKILTKDLGLSDIVQANTNKQITSWINYIRKDHYNTIKALDMLMSVSRKNLPKNFTEFTIKHIQFTKKFDFQKILSNYKTIYSCHSQNELQPNLSNLNQNTNVDVTALD